MKSIITKDIKFGLNEYWVTYQEWVKKNGHLFKEKKKKIALGHGIEKVQTYTNVDTEADQNLNKEEY